MNKEQLGKCECSRCGTDPYLEPLLKAEVDRLTAEIVKLNRRIIIADTYIDESDVSDYYSELEYEEL